MFAISIDEVSSIRGDIDTMELRREDISELIGEPENTQRIRSDNKCGRNWCEIHSTDWT